jgi:hypothetical protein
MNNLSDSQNFVCHGLIKLALLNSTVFFVLSLLGDYYNFQSIAYLVVVLAVFSMMSFFIYLIAVDRGLILVPIFWFILGAGIFYGLGTIPHIFKLFDQSSKVWYGGYSYDDIVKSCWINALACLIVLIFSYLFFQKIKINNQTFNNQIKVISNNLLNCFIAISCCIYMLKVITFPVSVNLILRGVLDKGGYFIYATVFLGTLLFFRLTFFQRFFIIFLVVSMQIVGVLSASKYDAIIPLMPVLIGFTLIKRDRMHLVSLVVIFAAYFILTSAVVNTIRGNCSYSVEKNSLADRVYIFKDVLSTLVLKETVCTSVDINKIPNSNINSQEYIDENTNFDVTTSSNQFFKILRRISTTSISTFLINRYDQGLTGDTVNNIYVYFIPRIIWPSKPVVTSRGGELAELYYPGDGPNSLGPTFSAELYWNYGLFGVIFGSALIGVIIGLLSRWSILFINGNFLGYAVIAVPAVTYAIWVESWFGSTYIGGFISMLQMLLAYFLTLYIFKYSSRLFFH